MRSSDEIEVISTTLDTPPALWLSISQNDYLLCLVILIDGLQTPNISGKDDLHHQICHQSNESKNTTLEWFLYIYLICYVWGL